MDFLNNHAYSFFYGLAAFLIFVRLVAKLGIKPIVAAIDERDAKIKKQLDEAEETFAKAKDLQSKLDAELAGAEAKISEMMAEARKDGEALKAKLVNDGQEELDAARQKSLREIAAVRQQAIVDVQNAVSGIAVEAAGKIIAAELDEAKHKALVEQAVAAYEQVGA